MARPPGAMAQVRTLPTFSVRIRSLCSRTCRCCTTAARETASGAARSLTDSGPSPSRSRSALRVGSPRAWNTESTLIDPPQYLSRHLTIRTCRTTLKYVLKYCTKSKETHHGIHPQPHYQGVLRPQYVLRWLHRPNGN